MTTLFVFVGTMYYNKRSLRMPVIKTNLFYHL
jgi:hypothetical protein